MAQDKEITREAALALSPLEVSKILGTSQRAIYTHFGIPKRTWEDWNRGIASPPDYVWLLILHTLGIYTMPDFAPDERRRHDPHA